MSLTDHEYRDEIAARVLEQLVAQWTRHAEDHITTFPTESTCRQAFEIAEAMVAERHRRP